MSAIYTIQPYRCYGGWVFDDPPHGLIREALIQGADLLLDTLMGDAPRGEITFSGIPLPNSERLVYLRAEMGGTTYRAEEHQHEVWLCSALLRYYPVPPATIYYTHRRIYG